MYIYISADVLFKQSIYVYLFVGVSVVTYLYIYIQAEDLFSNYIPKKISQLDNLLQVNTALKKYQRHD